MLLLGACIPAIANPPGWRLVWEDEFDTLDTERWRLVDTNVPTNKSLQDYLPAQVSVANGKLEILAENKPSRGLPFRSGQIISFAEQKHGRWEVHAKLPTTKGMWPAIWLLPAVDKHPWPSGGEIDFMENRGNMPTVTSSAFHYGTNPPFSHKFVEQQQQTRFGGRLVDYSADYHTYAVDWTKHYLRFYVDGVHHYTVHDEEVGGFLSEDVAPMQLVINNAIGGTFLPNPDDSTVWPQTMGVDWVRVYEADPNSAIPLVNPSFEANGGTLAGWTVFGADLIDNPNVLVEKEAAADGEASLKIFGPFKKGSTLSGASQGITVEGGERVTAGIKSIVRSQDSIAGSDNRVELKLEFYHIFGGKQGSPEMLSDQAVLVADANVQEDTWLEHTVSAVAPQGAVEARLSVVFQQPTAAGGAIHIDSANIEVVSND